MTCPSTEELCALYDGSLSDKRLQRLRDHAARCPRCCQEMGLLHRLLQDTNQVLAPSNELITRAKELAHKPALLRPVKPAPKTDRPWTRAPSKQR